MHEKENCSVRTGPWRYIRYHDGSEELYDPNEDIHEWNHLAETSEYQKIDQDLIKWLPK